MRDRTKVDFPARPRTAISRRAWLLLSSSAMIGVMTNEHASIAANDDQTTIFTFGDSVLDCARYNEHGVDPGQLIVRNNDVLFPEFKDRDLLSRGKARLVHRAVDGATVAGLPSQAQGIVPSGRCVAVLSIGGNDLLAGLAGDSGAGLRKFEEALNVFLHDLPIRPVLMGNVYDPTFGDDARNFLGVAAPLARANHRRVNQVIAECASRYGKLVDLHAHFLKGDPSWYTRTIEPSLVGASEIRRAFLPALGIAT
jgi:acyl-CoA thioesterase-1